MVMSELKHAPMDGRTSTLLAQQMAQFRRSPKPISVSFRELVPWIRYNSERATHLVHHYPAKVIPHIPHYFLQNEVLSSKGDFVLDPFCGTGTVMVESLLANRRPAGADANPLARLIAKVEHEAEGVWSVDAHRRGIEGRWIPESIQAVHRATLLREHFGQDVALNVWFVEDQQIQSFGRPIPSELALE